MRLGRRGKVTARRSGESGYAYLMALFIILAIIVASQIALQNLVTEGRRQREEETIWRGNQWARAVRLYFQKTGHYPQTTDDVEKGVLNLHFLRQSAYKDPMDTDEGGWRFIYVNASGQIIGSVRYATLQQMALIDLNGATLPAPAGLPGIPVSSIASGNSGSSSASTGSGASSSGANNPNQQAGGISSSQTSQGTSQNSTPDQSAGSPQSGAGASGQIPNPLLALPPTGPVDGPVIGGLLTGVGLPTKLDRNSVRLYHGAKKYKEWEFIWNPLEDQAQAVQQGLNPQGQQIGQPIGPGGIGTGSMGNPGSFGGAVVPPSSTPPSIPSPAPQQQ